MLEDTARATGYESVTTGQVNTSNVAMFPATKYWDNVTYIFPIGTGEGEWAVYAAGAGSPISIGGFLFEKITNTTGP